MIMAFADPTSITVDTVAKSLPRVSTGFNSSQYRNADGSFKLSISHNYGRRNRHLVRVDHEKIAPDPFSGANQKYSMSAYTVVDAPVAGFTTKELADVLGALSSFLGTAATRDRVIGGES
jgi:hypothetical protein